MTIYVLVDMYRYYKCTINNINVDGNWYEKLNCNTEHCNHDITETERAVLFYWRKKCWRAIIFGAKIFGIFFQFAKFSKKWLAKFSG